MGMERTIEVPLHEYEELVRDSERLRIITEKAVRTRKCGPTMEIDFVLLVAGYQDVSSRPEKCYNPNTHFGKSVAPAQQVRPEFYIDKDKLTERIVKSMQEIERHLGGRADERNMETNKRL